MVMLVTGESRQGPPSEVLLAMATARVVEQGVGYSRAQSIVERAREGRSLQTAITWQNDVDRHTYKRKLLQDCGQDFPCLSYCCLRGC